VALVRTGVLEERSSSIISVTRIGELGTTLTVTINRRTLRRNTMSVLRRATLRNIPENGIFHLLCVLFADIDVEIITPASETAACKPAMKRRRML
jgi:hypothetical protein